MSKRPDIKVHGNSKRNARKHHLYEIRDGHTKDVFKYGISAEPIGEDGLSSRVRRQVRMGNVFVGWLRFFGRILVRNIPGRKHAEEIEQHYIDRYERVHGRPPRGEFVEKTLLVGYIFVHMRLPKCS